MAGRDYFYENLDTEYWAFASGGTTLRLPRGHLAMENLSTAVASVLKSGLNVSEDAIIQGVQNASISGRFEMRIIQNKTVIFDAGHNAHGVEFLLRELKNFLQCNTQYTQIKAVFSMLADKDIQSVVQQLKPAIASWNIAALSVPRAAQLDAMVNALDNEPVEVFETISQAFTSALQQANEKQIILVCGSFHTLEAVWEYVAKCQ